MQNEADLEVAIVVLNYRNAPDTISCVHSLLADGAAGAVIIVCDNDSQDSSEELLRSEFSAQANVRFLQTGRNGGFAFGNNVGIRAALAIPSVKFIWILNNDTIVRPGSLEAMVQRMHSNARIGMLGATLVYFGKPHLVQAYGGSHLDRWTSISHHIGNGQLLDAAVSETSIERQLSFVSGASMFVSREFVEKVGLLSERYFLYFEEADWVARMGSAFELGFCRDAVIEHKEGATIGSCSADRRATPFSVFHICRSRLIFTATHRKRYLPTVVVRMLRYMLASLLKGDILVAMAIGRAMSGRSF